MIKANVISDYSIWKRNIKKPNEYLNKRLKILSRTSSFKRKNYEFSVLLTNNKQMKHFNFKFRKKNKTTDVLSFPFYEKSKLKNKFKNEKEVYLGDIIINLSKIKNKKNKKKFILEFNKLWIHGLVHLFGYNHIKIKEFKEMKKIEKKFLFYIN